MGPTRARSWPFCAGWLSACSSIRSRLPAVRRQSVTAADVARLRGQNVVIRQVAFARFDWAHAVLTAWVAPTVVPRHSLLGRTDGPQNAALIRGEHAGEIGISGPGAGGSATAVAVISDLIAIARDRSAVVPPASFTTNFSMDRSDAGLSCMDDEVLRAAQCSGLQLQLQRRLCERVHRIAMPSLQDTSFPAEAIPGVCDRCLGPLEPVYDYSAIKMTREKIAARPENLWRYRELLPIVGEPRTGFNSGFTPLVRCTRLAEHLNVSELYIKDDSVNHPTLSYKDRVVSVAATRALELGFKVLACASTGNLANSVAAHAARLGVECCVMIPDNLEAGKLLGSAIFNPTILAIAGNYDDVNRLCTQVADRVRVGLRQHQPARVLRRRRQDDGLRNRRAAGVEISSAPRVSGRRRDAVAKNRSRPARVATGRPGRGRVAARVCRAGGRMCTGRDRAAERTPIIRSRSAPIPSQSRSRSGTPRTATR